MKKFTFDLEVWELLLICGGCMLAGGAYGYILAYGRFNGELTKIEQTCSRN